ncbi:hypothetical protein V1517DRAFT_375755 [Lipomyces orientalis]|uniref:Uncharacterized protein n=1 Tax=Lipomyces orientalis TaxID=1233043 RepID=A0ACC3THU8_9ASCO
MSLPAKLVIGSRDWTTESATQKELLKIAREHGITTLDRVKVCLPIYLLHGPDAEQPISETLDAIQELYLAGKFEQICSSETCQIHYADSGAKQSGLSNFGLAQILEVHN